jgi:hypothetical protein
MALCQALGAGPLGVATPPWPTAGIETIIHYLTVGSTFRQPSFTFYTSMGN